MEGSRELKPLGIGEVVDLAVNLWARNWRTLLAVSAAVILPLTVIVFALDAYAFQEIGVLDAHAAAYRFGNGQIRILNESRYNAIQLIELVIVILGYQVAIAANLQAAGDAYLGGGADTRRALRLGFRRMHSILWVSIIYLVLVVLGFFLLIVPGIWLLIALAVS